MTDRSAAAVPLPPAPTAYARKLLPTALVSVSALLLFGVQTPFGYATLAAGLLVGFGVDRQLFRHLAIIALGLLIISTVPLNADLSLGHMALMGGALALAVIVPWLIDHFVYRERIIRFPMFTGQKWSLAAKLYLPGVVLLGYLILPVYLISTDVYQNWPDASSDPTIFWRLFVGVNAVGIWDELFFICTVFTLLLRHFPVWIANLLTAVMFSSFLWEIGYEAWGPLLTFPFALLQGYTFRLTKSFTYVVSVHLLFDLVLFLALVHAHDRSFLPIFVY